MGEFNRIKNAISKLLKKEFGEEGLHGIRFLTPGEWSDRGEPYLCNSKLVMIFEENVIYGLLNYMEDKGKFYDKLWETMRNKGYYFELGNSWNLGIYEK